MIGVLFATKMEAAPLLARLQAKPVEHPSYDAFSATVDGTPLCIAIAGMGKQKATATARVLARDPAISAIVNIGACGGLTSDRKPGDIVTISSAGDADTSSSPGNRHPLAANLRTWPRLVPVRLGTVTTPVFDDTRRAALAGHYDVVDMEGAAIAQICKEYDVPCFMLKGITDSASDNAGRALHDNLDAVSRALADRFICDLPRILPIDSGSAASFMRFTRIEHTVFSVPLLFAGAWLGASSRMPAITDLLLILVVGTGARTFGMAMNRILDRDIDSLNPRTANRELPAGRLSLAKACAIAASGLGLYLFGCAALGRLCLLLAPVPLIPLSIYALLKRFTPLCHVGIGMCLGVAPLGAYVATSGRLPLAHDILYLATFTTLWMCGFDIIYALQDLQFDRDHGVHSIPAALGVRGAQIVAALCHFGAIACLASLWVDSGSGTLAGISLAVSAAAFVAAYHPKMPLPVRFFPISAIAGIAGACTVLLGGVP